MFVFKITRVTQVIFYVERFSIEFFVLAVMRAAVIDINADEQRDIIRRLFRESGNVNVQTKEVRSIVYLYF